MNSMLNQTNKETIWNYWSALQGSTAENVYEIVASVMHEDIRCFGPDPINEMQGSKALVDKYWAPLLRSFPDLQRQTYIFCGGQSNGQANGDVSNDSKMWVSGTGHFSATFAEDYLSIPASGKKVELRWGEFYRLEDGKVVDFYFLLDLVDLMKQAGFEVLPPILGKDQRFPPPEYTDGILLEAQNTEETDRQLKQIRSFVYDSLNSFDQNDVSSMGVADYFDTHVCWYGPGGIGSCYSLTEFEDFHQKPWLVAFPNRQNQDLDCLYAEGLYTAGSGWAGTKAVQSGPFRGVEATQNPLQFNGMDWWRSDAEKYVENWVFVDMVFLFRQIGVDLFARLAQQLDASRNTVS